MPTIVILGRLKIQIYPDDHNPPHFHAVTPDNEAIISLTNLKIIKGEIARRDYDRMLHWASEPANRELLHDAW